MRTLGTKQPSNQDATHQKPVRTAPVPVARSLSTGLTGSAMLQRKPSCACGGGCPRCRDEDTLQSKLKISEPEVPPSLESYIQQRQGLGQPIAETTRTKMESFFGADFSNVNIHTDNQAVQMNQSLNAQAFTVGNDIFFNFGKYTPGSAVGDHLLSHELTHVIQQTKGHQSFIQRTEDEEQMCGGEASDSFKLTMATCRPPIALIGLHNQLATYDQMYHIGDYLNDYMTILDIPCVERPSHSKIVVAHCDKYETIYSEPENHKVDEAQGCSGKVSDIFKLQTVISASPKEFSVALIWRHNPSTSEIEAYNIGDYLNDYMQIVDMPPANRPSDSKVIVAHCENYETLDYETLGEPEESPRPPRSREPEIQCSDYCKEDLGPPFIKNSDADGGNLRILYKNGEWRLFPKESSVEGGCLTFKPTKDCNGDYDLYDCEGKNQGVVTLSLEELQTPDFFGPLIFGNVTNSCGPFEDPFR